MSTVRIGISGWRYAGWRGKFYPKGLPQARELAFASRCFDTLELNGSFYSLQSRKSYLDWYRTVPEGFLFAVKGPRYVTHLLRLKNVEVPLANFFASGVLTLGEKLGPFLWQFPPRFPWDEERFRAFFRRLPRDTRQAARLARRHDGRVKAAVPEPLPRRPVAIRHSVEIRHPSFVTPRFFDLLRRERIGLVVADTAGKWPFLEQTPSDLVYVRLHGDAKLYESGYGKAALDRWARRVRRWHSRGKDVFVYFDNDAKVRAPFDALALRNRLEEEREPWESIADSFYARR